MVQQKVKAPVLPRDSGVEQAKIFQPAMQYQNSGPNYGQASMYQNVQPPLNNGPINNAVNNNFFNPINKPNVPAVGFNPIQNNNSNSGNNTPVPPIARKVSLPVVEKQPLPDEYIHIQTVFDDLLKRCMDMSAAPAPRRKLEEVGKKIEVLYDKLRDRTVSS
jgi:hypothetical protein